MVELDDLVGGGNGDVVVAVRPDHERVRSLVRSNLDGEGGRRPQDLARGVVSLDDAPDVVEDMDDVLAVDGDSDRVAELARPDAEGPPRSKEPAFAVEVLDPPVAGVEDVERAVRRERDRPIWVVVGRGEGELAVPAPGSPP